MRGRTPSNSSLNRNSSSILDITGETTISTLAIDAALTAQHTNSNTMSSESALSFDVVTPRTSDNSDDDAYRQYPFVVWSDSRSVLTNSNSNSRGVEDIIHAAWTASVIDQTAAFEYLEREARQQRDDALYASFLQAQENEEASIHLSQSQLGLDGAEYHPPSVVEIHVPSSEDEQERFLQDPVEDEWRMGFEHPEQFGTDQQAAMELQEHEHEEAERMRMFNEIAIETFQRAVRVKEEERFKQVRADAEYAKQLQQYIWVEEEEKAEEDILQARRAEQESAWREEVAQRDLVSAMSQDRLESAIASSTDRMNERGLLAAVGNAPQHRSGATRRRSHSRADDDKGSKKCDSNAPGTEETKNEIDAQLAHIVNQVDYIAERIGKIQISDARNTNIRSQPGSRTTTFTISNGAHNHPSADIRGPHTTNSGSASGTHSRGSSGSTTVVGSGSGGIKDGDIAHPVAHSRSISYPYAGTAYHSTAIASARTSTRPTALNINPHEGLVAARRHLRRAT
jgi:hypothetical protein